MLRSVMTLLLGSGLAQLGPLAFGPVLSRLYGPEVFGLFHLASAVGMNIAVVACARYEFALPMVTDEAEAHALRRLCVRILLAVSGACVVGALGAAWWWRAAWPLGVPLLVAGAGALSLWTLEATRRQRFKALATARVVQFWGCGAVQTLWGLVHAGVWGLLVGPALAAGAAAWMLGRSARAPSVTVDESASTAGTTAATATATSTAPGAGPTTIPTIASVARHHRDFPLLNTPHAFLGALQDTASIALIAWSAGPAAAGVWGLVLRYLKAPATLVGGAVSQVLYPMLGGPSDQRAELRRVLCLLLGAAAGWGLAVQIFSAWALPTLLGAGWEDSGAVGQALAPYIALHFVASPLGVVTMAWKAQAWALKVAVAGQLLFVAALAGGLMFGGQGLFSAAWAVSLFMTPFFLWYFWRLWTWPVQGGVNGPDQPRDPGSDRSHDRSGDRPANHPANHPVDRSTDAPPPRDNCAP